MALSCEYKRTPAFSGKLADNITKLSAARVQTCTDIGLHRYAAALRDAKCHSDEEFEPSSGAYIVHAKAGRSARMTQLLQKLDDVRLSDTKRLGRSLPHVRKRVDNPPPSLLSALPRKTSLDWFDVDFFNSLSHRVRRVVAKPGIILGPDPDHVQVQPPHDVELMTMKAFMEKHGEIIMSQYNIPDSDCDSDDDTSDNDYWLKEDKMDVDADSDNDDEEMAEAVDAALSEQQDMFYLKIAL